jgi:hypothetical protein
MPPSRIKKTIKAINDLFFIKIKINNLYIKEWIILP